MKPYLLAYSIAVMAALAAPAQATTLTSPNYSINAGRITSGGSSASDAAGMTKSGIAIGQAVFIPAIPPASPSYSTTAAVLASPAISTPPVQVSTLPDGTVTASSPLTVSGKVNTQPLPASITVNGIPVSINPDGSYSVSVPLTTGSNTITVRVVNQDGSVTTQSRTITYNPTTPPVNITSIANNSTLPTTQTTIPVSGTVGPNVSTVTISVNGGAPQTVTVVNGSFSAMAGVLSPGLNNIVVTTNTGISTVLTVWSSNGGSLLAHTGDINGDGVVDIVDALLALKAGVGLVQLASAETSRGDVGPLVNNVAVGDGRIDIEDAMLILRKAVGLGW